MPVKNDIEKMTKTMPAADDEGASPDRDVADEGEDLAERYALGPASGTGCPDDAAVEAELGCRPPPAWCRRSRRARSASRRMTAGDGGHQNFWGTRAK